MDFWDAIPIVIAGIGAMLIILMIFAAVNENRVHKTICEKNDMIYIESPHGSCATSDGRIYSIEILKKMK